MKIIEKPEFVIKDGYLPDGEGIFTAGTTCYRSEEHTKKTKEDFIKMFKTPDSDGNCHSSPLEFSWFVFRISVNVVSPGIRRTMDHEIKSYYQAQKYLNATQTTDGKLLVSGNGRAWLEFLSNHYFYTFADNDIAMGLATINPFLFGDLEFDIEKSVGTYNVDYIPYEDMWNEIPPQHFDKHHWAMVKMTGVSRALTHELVRHRTFSFAQASTRYINNENFDVCFSTEDMLENIHYFERMSVMGALMNLKYAYNMLKRRVGNKTARRVLPISISNEICVGGNMEAWQSFFRLRTGKRADYEIRDMALAIQEEFRKREWVSVTYPIPFK
jgi:thymidylate synthase ThyX